MHGGKTRVVVVVVHGPQPHAALAATGARTPAQRASTANPASTLRAPMDNSSGNAATGNTGNLAQRDSPCTSAAANRSGRRRRLGNREPPIRTRAGSRARTGTRRNSPLLDYRWILSARRAYQPARRPVNPTAAQFTR